MKKMIIYISMFIVLLSGAAENKTFSLLDYYSGEYFSYSNQPLKDNSIYTGSCYINSEINSKEIIGESITVKNFEPSAAIKELKAKVVKTEYLESGAIVIYAYSKFIPKSVKLESEKVNLQIAYYETHSIIGWPLILGSF